MLYQIVSENGQKVKKSITGNGYGLPLGSIIAVYSNLVPDGYLPCNGAVYDTTTYAALYAYLGSNRLPDLRECNLVGAGQSSNDYDASTNPNGIHEHDVYTVGQFKDDQMQRITGTWESTSNRGGTNSGDGALFTSYGSAGWLPNGSQTSGTNKGVRFDNAKVVRTGYDSSGTLVGTDTTHGKQVGVNYCIKATPAYVEPDTVSDMVNTLRTQDSYSTSEVNTGKKWIDGKPIYRKVFIFKTQCDETTHFEIPNCSEIVTNGLLFRDTYGSSISPIISTSNREQSNCYVTLTWSNGGEWVDTGGHWYCEYTKTTD